MKRILIYLLLFMVAGCNGTLGDPSASPGADASPKANFKSPDAASGPRCW